MKTMKIHSGIKYKIQVGSTSVKIKKSLHCIEDHIAAFPVPLKGAEDLYSNWGVMTLQFE